MSPPLQAAAPTYSLIGFQDLEGWGEDNQQAALTVFLKTCNTLKSQDWPSICAIAATHPNARSFFELFFRPVLIRDRTPSLFTGYFEPELPGSLTKTAQFQYPIYRKPPEVRAGVPWLTRREIEKSSVLRGRGLALAWIEDPVDVFFLQIQGSGRIRLANGRSLRLGFGGSNGRNYRSIGKELIRRGVFSSHQVSAQVIKNWVRRNPAQGAALLQHNPGYVFFRKVRADSAVGGPIGAMNRPVTAGRSLAVDPRFTPLGAPVWIEKGGRRKIHRLMIAQDTGSAIKGAQRADIFFGSGAAAGRVAGQVRDSGRMVVLLPNRQAFALASGDQ